MKNTTDRSIDTLRGFAIFFIIVAHVIGYNKSFGMRVDDSSVYRYFYYTLQFLRIPLFTTISGFVYGYRPLQSGNAGLFLAGKVRRLLLPLFVGTIIKYILNLFINRYDPGELLHAWQFFFMPFGHLWFLQTIFLVFICIAILETLGLLKNFISFFTCLLISLLGAYFTAGTLPNFFSIDNLPHLLFFFLLGLGMHRFPDNFFRAPVIVPVAVLFAAGLIVQQLNWFLHWDMNTDYKSILGFWVAITGMLVFFRYRKNISIISWLGAYSFSIYLYHLIGTAGTLFLFRQLGLEYKPLLFIFSILCGVGIPIFLEREMFSRHRITRLVFLGLRTKK